MLRLRPRIKLKFRPRIKLKFRPRIKLKFRPRIKLKFRPRIELKFRPRIKLKFRPRIKLRLSQCPEDVSFSKRVFRLQFSSASFKCGRSICASQGETCHVMSCHVICASHLCQPG